MSLFPESGHITVTAGDTWVDLGEVPAGKRWTLDGLTATNRSGASNPVSFRFLDASNGFTPHYRAVDIALASASSVAMLTSHGYYNAGDILQVKATTNYFGTKSGAMTSGTSPTGIAHDGTSKLLVVGTVGRIHHSTDLGETWTFVDLATSATLSAPAYGAGVWVLHDGSNFRSSSDGGNTWVTRTAASFTASKTIFVTGSINLFVCVGSGGNLWTSPDGLTWTSRTSGVSVALNDVAFNGTTILAVGAPAPTNAASCTSTNGTSWTAQATNIAVTLLGVAYSTALSAFMAISSTVTYSTTDGITYTTRTATAATNVSIASNGTEFVIFAASTAYVYASLTGSPISRLHTTTPAVKPIYVAAKYFFAQGTFAYYTATYTTADAISVDFTGDYVEEPA